MSHTAAAAAADDVVDALFYQAGVLRVDTTEQLLDVTRVLLEQPLPAGNRVVIIGNAGGSGILAADAAERAGLRVVELPAEAAAAIRRLVPSAASCENPVDLGAGVPAERFGAAVRVAAAAPGVDAVVVVFVETAVSDPQVILDAIAAAAASIDRPLLITRVGATQGFWMCRTEVGGVRCSPFRSRPRPRWRWPPGTARSAGGWPLRRPGATGGADRDKRDRGAGPGVDARAGMAGCRGRVRGVASLADRRRRAADGGGRGCRGGGRTRVGYPVAVKLAAGGDAQIGVGGVRVGLTDAAGVREAFAAVSAAGSGGPVLVQAMVPGDLELITGGVQDAQFGPVVMVGMGGTLTGLLADRAFRLAPGDRHGRRGDDERAADEPGAGRVSGCRPGGPGGGGRSGHPDRVAGRGFPGHRRDRPESGGMPR